jgi:hypothetical protein
MSCHQTLDRMMTLVMSKPCVKSLNRTSKTMSQWSSGYEIAIISQLFDEKIDEDLIDIFLCALSFLFL